MNEPGLYNRDDIVPTDTESKEGVKVYEYRALSQIEEARLIDILRSAEHENKDKRYSVHLVDGKSEAAQLGRSLEATVFLEFFSNDEDTMQKAYRPYEEYSRFLLVIDQANNLAVGVMRLVDNSPNGLKSLQDLQHEPWNKPLAKIFAENDIKPAMLDKTWDIATLAVRDGYRGKSEVSSALYHGLYQSSVALGKTEWVAILDDNVMELLEKFSLFFSKYKDVAPGSYLDSPSSTPVYANVHQMVEVRMRNADFGSYEYLALGKHGIRDDIDFSGIGNK